MIKVIVDVVDYVGGMPGGTCQSWDCNGGLHRAALFTLGDDKQDKPSQCFVLCDICLKKSLSVLLETNDEY